MKPPVRLAALLVCIAVVVPSSGQAGLDLEGDELVQSAAADIQVTGYSVPSTADWNGDALPDLIVGEGGGGYVNGRVRVYVNVGTAAEPLFDGFVYAQSLGAALTVPASGCLGAFPRVVNWDGDGRKDLLVGGADGVVRIFLNTATDENPAFDGGTPLTVGPAGSKITIDKGSRATPSLVDWDNDSRRDLVLGDISGRIYVFINSGTDSAPDYLSAVAIQAGGSDFLVPSGRASPHILDLNDDGAKDILTGNTNGQILQYINEGTDAAPAFSGYSAVHAADIPIDLPGSPRSRPFVCDWNDDGSWDLLIGSADGKVHLCNGVASPTGVPVARDPLIVRLHAYPNPFRALSTITFELTRPGPVRLAIYDLSGRQVVVLAEGFLDQGSHQERWNGRDAGGRLTPSGIYYYGLEVGGRVESRPVVRLN